MKWSGHAYTRALYRLETDQFSLANYIMIVDKQMQQISLKETEKIATITSLHKGDKYFRHHILTKMKYLLLMVEF